MSPLINSANTYATIDKTQHMLEMVLNNIPTRVFWKDRELVPLGWNSAFGRDMGLESNDGQRSNTEPNLLQIDQQFGTYGEEDARIIATGRPQLNIEQRVTRADGKERWLRLNKVPLLDADGNVFGILGTYDDITGQKEAHERHLADEKRQRDTLVREVHHRIKNHLQGIIGLLQIQAAEHPDISEPLEHAVGQINAIALIHGLQSKTPEEMVDLITLLHSICRAMEDVQGRRVRLDRAADLPPRLTIAADEAVPVALVLNELLQNAFKHSPGEDKGQAVSVEVEREGDARLAVTITNTGKALPDSFSWNAGLGLGTGLNLVKSLLPKRGVQLSIQAEAGSIVSRLELGAPVIDYG